MKKLLIFGLFVAVLAFLVFYVLPRGARQQPSASEAQPAPWNSGAMHSTFAGVQVREVDPAHAELVFSYDLDNNTESDYRLTKGPSTVVMTRLKSNGTLSSDEPVDIVNSVFLPAKNRTRISLQVMHPFNWPAGLVPGQIGPANQEKFRAIVAEEVANYSGFVLFDQSTHFQIELPGGWQELHPSPNTAGLN
jgi:hypothetical protein